MGKGLSLCPPRVTVWSWKVCFFHCRNLRLIGLFDGKSPVIIKMGNILKYPGSDILTELRDCGILAEDKTVVSSSSVFEKL